MRCRHVWKRRRFIAIAIAGSCVLHAVRATAQVTTYGQDPVPGASESYEPWGGYGTDPVPHNRFDEHGYIRAYGFDQVPGTPPAYAPGTLRRQMQWVLPNQTQQVLTSDG